GPGGCRPSSRSGSGRPCPSPGTVGRAGRRTSFSSGNTLSARAPKTGTCRFGLKKKSACPGLLSVFFPAHTPRPGARASAVRKSWEKGRERWQVHCSRRESSLSHFPVPQDLEEYSKNVTHATKFACPGGLPRGVPRIGFVRQRAGRRKVLLD